MQELDGKAQASLNAGQGAIIVMNPGVHDSFAEDYLFPRA
jgi:hypothetical protein